MQYADIALSVKTKDRQASYTYRIPPALLADIQLGQRVAVPFAGRKLIGTITSLRAVPPKIRGALKEVTGLVEPFPFFDEPTLVLAREVAQLYGATVGQILETASPKPAKRIAKKLELTPSITANRSRNYQILSLSKPLQQRLADYLELIKKAREQNQAALVLWPTQELCQHFSSYLTEQGVGNMLMPPTAELTAHYEAWIAARTGTASVVIGTRKSIFVPIAQLRLIIVDGPSLYGYKEEQFPYYHALTVAKLKARLTHSHLVIGDVAPRLQEWSEGQHDQLTFLAESPEPPPITVIDTTSHRGLISEVLIRHIEEAVQKKQRVALYYNRKGSGRFYHCLDCETAIYCPRCDTLLTVFSEEQGVRLRCSHCNYDMPPPYRCTVCQSYKMGVAGLGVESLAKIIRERLPEARVVTLSQATDQLPAYDILVATAELFYLPPQTHFGLLATFHVDQLLHGPGWDTNETAYLILSHLAERTDQLLIHTIEPTHPVIQALSTGNRQELYRHELQERTVHHFPPAAPLIRLLTSGTDEAKVKAAAEALYEKYRQLIPEAEQRLFPPSPIGTGKRRGKFRYQIIMKSALTKIILDNLPVDWQIDPEPREI